MRSGAHANGHCHAHRTHTRRNTHAYTSPHTHACSGTRTYHCPIAHACANCRAYSCFYSCIHTCANPGIHAGAYT